MNKVNLYSNDDKARTNLNIDRGYEVLNEKCTLIFKIINKKEFDKIFFIIRKKYFRIGYILHCVKTGYKGTFFYFVKPQNSLDLQNEKIKLEILEKNLTIK